MQSPFDEGPRTTRFDPVRNVRLLVQRKLWANRAVLQCSNPMGMLMIAEYVAETEFHGFRHWRNPGYRIWARAISFDGLALIAWADAGALIIERYSLLPSVLRSRHREHNAAVLALAQACQMFAETKELPELQGLSEPAMVTPNGQGWVHCPHCGWHFSLARKDSWNGDRHMTCGKRLRIER